MDEQTKAIVGGVAGFYVVGMVSQLSSALGSLAAPVGIAVGIVAINRLVK